MSKKIPPGGSVSNLSKTKNGKRLLSRLLPDEEKPTEIPEAMLTDVERVRIPLDMIKFFEKNPRVKVNEEYDQIKSSIRSVGLEQDPHVTKLPGDEKLTLDRGGNTRLKILNELWEETHDDRFWHIWVLVHPFDSETLMLARHLSENNTRGDMSFWDNCVGHMNLWETVEAEYGIKLSAPKMEPEFLKYGLSTKKSYLYRYQFAWNQLQPLGEAVIYLSGLQVGNLQTPFKHFVFCCKTHSEALLKEIPKALKLIGSEVKGENDLKASKVMEQLYQHCADFIEMGVDDFKKVIETAKKYKNDDFQRWIDRSFIYSPANTMASPDSDNAGTPVGTDKHNENANPNTDDPFAEQDRILNEAKNNYINYKEDVSRIKGPNGENFVIHNIQPHVSPELDYVPFQPGQFASQPRISSRAALDRIHELIEKLNYSLPMKLIPCETGFGFYVDTLRNTDRYIADMGTWMLFAGISCQMHKGVLNGLPDSQFKRIWSAKLENKEDELNDDDKSHLIALMSNLPNPIYFLSSMLWGSYVTAQYNTVSFSQTTWIEPFIPSALELVKRCIDFAGTCNEYLQINKVTEIFPWEGTDEELPKIDLSDAQGVVK